MIPGNNFMDLRTGIIVGYNSKIRLGTIKDSNGQKVRFHNENAHIEFGRLEVVRYMIGFVNGSLMATNVEPVIDIRGSRVTLKIYTD